MNWLRKKTAGDERTTTATERTPSRSPRALDGHRRRLPFDGGCFATACGHLSRSRGESRNTHPHGGGGPATAVVGSITGTQYQTSLRPNPFQSQADRGLGPAIAPIGGGSGPSSAASPAGRRRRSRLNCREDGDHGARPNGTGFFGSVVGAATDGDALEPGMNASAADIDLAAAPARRAVRDRIGQFSESSGFPGGRDSRAWGTVRGAGEFHVAVIDRRERLGAESRDKPSRRSARSIA